MRRVLDAPLPRDWRLSVTVVDDASGPQCARSLDEARAALEEARDAPARGGPPPPGHLARPAVLQCAVIRHPVNRGKGAALRTGFDHVLSIGADTDMAVIHDADLEYDPRDFAALLGAAERCDAARGCVAIYGNRWSIGGEGHAGAWRRIHRLGNGVLTVASNLATGYRLSDMECCYKLVPLTALRRIRPMLTEDRFGIEPQLTAALARIGARIDEEPVRYDARAYRQGKKIGVRDAMRTIWVIVRERLREPRTAHPPRDTHGHAHR